MQTTRLWLMIGSMLATGACVWSCGLTKHAAGVTSSAASPRPRAEDTDAGALAPANQAWIARVIRTLHPGRRATAEQIAKYQGKLKGEVVDELISDPAFSEMVLDYSRVFLGQAPNPGLSLDLLMSTYDPFVRGSTVAALHATHQYATSGEYLELLDYSPVAYMNKLKPPSRRVEDYKKTEGENGSIGGLPDLPDLENLLKGTDSQIRSGIMAHVTQLANTLETNFEKAGSTDALCLPSPDSENKPPISILSTRMAAAAAHLGLTGWVSTLFAGSLGGFSNACDPDNTPDAQARLNAAKSAFIRLNTLLRSLPSIISEFERLSSAGADQGIASLIPFSFSILPADLQPPRPPDALGLEFFLANNNSSTNFNRRRGATILKRYFCDNLIPLEIAMPSDGSSHGAGRHASDPACQACHYKLDPMAGFFRSKGISGFEFLNPSDLERKVLEDFKIPEAAVGEFLVYDDLAVVVHSDLYRYLDSWKFVDGSGPAGGSPTQPWNVGYIRSLSNPDRNDYGSDLTDLFRIIRRAPEVKRCMTQKLADYVMGTGLRYDPAWLDSLSQPLIHAGETGQGSSQALRDTVKALVLSNTFSKRDPDPSVCYDRMDPSSPVPCEVASIIQQSCAQSCHSSAVKLGRLALDTWIPDASRSPLKRGQFDHRDESGTLLAPAVSFARIKERIMSGDPNLKMPPQEMDQRARADLYLWLEAREQEALK